MVTERDSIFFGFFILKYEFGPVMLPGLSRNLAELLFSQRA